MSQKLGLVGVEFRHPCRSAMKGNIISNNKLVFKALNGLGVVFTCFPVVF